MTNQKFEELITHMAEAGFVSITRDFEGDDNIVLVHLEVKEQLGAGCIIDFSSTAMPTAITRLKCEVGETIRVLLSYKIEVEGGEN